MKKYKIIEDGIEYDVEEYSAEEYWLNGYKYSNGDKFYYLNNKLHRESGPAVEHFDGHKAWYKNNKCHREDGPAIILKSGAKEYWLNGKWYPDISSDEELLLASIIT